MASRSDPRAIATGGLVRRIAWTVVGFAAVAWSGIALLDRPGWTLFAELSSPRHAERVRAYASRAAAVDLAIVGSSRVDQGLEAGLAHELLNLRTEDSIELHKLGLPGLEPALLAEVLERITSARPPRRLLVIGIEPRFFAERNQVEGLELDPVGVAPPRELAWLRGARAWATLVELLDPSVRGRIAEYRRLHGDDPRRVERRPAARPSASPRPSGTDLERRERLGPVGWRWNADGHPCFAHWERALDLVERLPCRVLFVRMPVRPSYLLTSAADTEQRFQDRIVAGLADRGLPFVDMARAPYPTADNLFRDPSHLSRHGAERATRLLVERELRPRLERARSDS